MNLKSFIFFHFHIFVRPIHHQPNAKDFYVTTSNVWTVFISIAMENRIALMAVTRNIAIVSCQMENFCAILGTSALIRKKSAMIVKIVSMEVTSPTNVKKMDVQTSNAMVNV